jgi:Retrotransposon gag protein
MTMIHDSPHENYTRYYDDREMHQTPLTNYSPRPPPDFDGSDEIDLVSQFLDEIEDYEPSVTEDPEILHQCISSILKGYALEWFQNSNSAYYCNDWADFRKDFINEFYDRPKNLNIWKQIVDTLQMHNESLRDYAAYTISLFDQLSYEEPERTIARHIFDGMRQDSLMKVEFVCKRDYLYIGLNDLLSSIPIIESQDREMHFKESDSSDDDYYQYYNNRDNQITSNAQSQDEQSYPPDDLTPQQIKLLDSLEQLQLLGISNLMPNVSKSPNVNNEPHVHKNFQCHHERTENDFDHMNMMQRKFS